MILIVGTGGTIAGTVGEDGTYQASLGTSELIETVRGRLGTEVSSVDFNRKLSFEIGLDEWLDLIAALRRWNEASEVEGVVVTQGTALLEEVPFLCSLFLEPNKPFVFTGAMVPLSHPGSDATGNVLDAVAVARDARSAGYGPLVVMGRRVVAAEAVLKAHKSSPASFAALGGGLLAEVDHEGVHWLRPPTGFPLHFANMRLASNVAILKVALGLEASFVSAVLATAPRGMVVEGFPGGGGISTEIEEILLPHIDKIPIVLASRSPGGRLVRAAGGRSGGGALLRKGFISSGSLTAARARLLLMAALGNLNPGEAPLPRIRAVFERLLQYEGRAPA